MRKQLKQRKPTNILDHVQRNDFNTWAKICCGDMMGQLLNIFTHVTSVLEEGDYDGAIKELEAMVEHIQMFQAPIRERMQEIKNRKYRGGGKVVKFERGKKWKTH